MKKEVLTIHPEVNKRKSGDSFNVEIFTEDFHKRIYEIITNCIKHHQRIIELSMTVEEEFNFLILLQVLSGVAMTCFQLFQLSVVRIPCRTKRDIRKLG